jgi:hypothetical protein
MHTHLYASQCNLYTFQNTMHTNLYTSKYNLHTHLKNYTKTRIRTLAYIYTHKNSQVVYTHIYTKPRICALAYVHSHTKVHKWYIHTFTIIRTHSNTATTHAPRTQVHTNICTCMHTYIDTTHIHAHIHTHHPILALQPRHYFLLWTQQTQSLYIHTYIPHTYMHTYIHTIQF